MHSFGRSIVFGAGLIGALGVTAGAQTFGTAPLYHDSRTNGPFYGDDNDRGRYDDRDSGRERGPRRNNRRNNDASVIDRVLSDLNRTASRTRTDNHEREHFRRASHQLYEFRQKWAQGNFDRGKLDRAIEDLEHLTNSNQIRGQDRSILASDLSALRNFRANGGRYSSGSYDSYRR